MAASIDVKLAPLIRVLWRLGAETTGCCQERPAHARRHPGYAWVAMPAESAARLAAALCDGPGDTDTRRMRRRACGDSAAGRRWFWEAGTGHGPRGGADIRHVPGALAAGPVRYEPPWEAAAHSDGSRWTPMAGAPLEITLYLPPEDVPLLTAHLQLLAPEPERPARDGAATWLRDRLRRGPAPAAEIREMADAVGISARTLERAKAAAGVRSVRQGFGPGAAYLWELPD